MKIDKDIDFKKTKTLNNISKKPVDKKLILIGVGIILLIIIIALITLFILPVLDFSGDVTLDNNDNAIDSDVNNVLVNVDDMSQEYCVFLNKLTPTGRFAIAADTNTTEKGISTKNENAPYFLIFDGSNKEFMTNPYIDQNDASKVVAFLKEQNLKGIILGLPNKEMASAMKTQGIKCYKSTEIIKYFILEETPVNPNLGCALLKSKEYGTIENIYAIAADSNSINKGASSKDSDAKYFQLFDGNTLVEMIKNPVIDTNANISVLITLLQDKNVTTVISGTPKEEFKTALADANIVCYNSSEIIHYIINRVN
ncbi:MAG: hypothetical protein WC915_02750 [archaeon]|jgi:predicted Fe-Mo cluster-binding NifX family protein